MSYSVTARFPRLRVESDAVTDASAIQEKQSTGEATSDEELIAAVSVGAKEALSLLFRRYSRSVRALGSRILRDFGEADDLVQEVFLYIHRKSALFDGSKGSARSWIIQVAYTQALLRRRQLKSRGLYSSGIIDNSGENLLNRSESTNYIDTIEGLFGTRGWNTVWSSLTEFQQETFRLHFYEGCNFNEIAEKLGQSYVNIRHHYYRGLEKLRKHAEDNGLRWP